MEDGLHFSAEMDEMMVQDAGVVPDMQTEITLGDDNSNSVNPSDLVALSLQQPMTATEDEIFPNSGISTRSSRRTTYQSPVSSRRGRAGAAGTASKDAVEPDSGSLLVSADTTTGDEVGRTRSSGRSSRRKFDPDFCYDNSIALAGGRKRTAAAAHKSPVNLASSISPSTSRGNKRVNYDDVAPVETSKAVMEKSSSSVSDTTLLLVHNTMVASPEIPPIEMHVDSVLLPTTDVLDRCSPLPDTESPLIIAEESSPTRRLSKGSVSENESDDEAATDNMDRTKLYCICQKPYGNRFMISCDKCEEWYHGTCVGVTKNKGKMYQKKNLPWVCPACRRKLSSASGADATPSQSGSEAPEHLQDAPFSNVPLLEIIKADTPLLSEEEPAQPIAHEEVVSTVSTRSKKKMSEGASAAKSGARKKRDSAAEKPVAPPPPKKTVKQKNMLEAKEFAQKRRTTSESKAKASKRDKDKEEEKPVESKSDGLVLTPLGMPRATGRSVRPHGFLHSSPPVARNLVRQNSGVSFSSPFGSTSSAFDTMKPTNHHNTTKVPFVIVKAEPKPHHVEKVEKPVTCGVRPCRCATCKVAPAREGSLYCSSNCIMRHGMEALELVRATPGTPDDRIRVVERHTGNELTGIEAPPRSTLLAWLESHQAYYVPIPVELLQARAEKASKSPQLDTVRGSTRTMLKEHLMNRWKKARDLHGKFPAEAVATVAQDIEAGLFKVFKEPNAAYKKKYRAIVLNINDLKNENFFRRVIRKEIEPEKVADLTQEQMASDTLALWRQTEMRKELDMIIQTQKEDAEQKPGLKKTHKGEEEVMDEFEKEKEMREDKDPIGSLDLSDLKNNFSPAYILSPSGGMSPSFSSRGGPSPRHTIRSPSPHTDLKPKTESVFFPQPPIPTTASPAVVKDTTAEHDDHVFDPHCSTCTSSLATFKPNMGKSALSSLSHAQSPNQLDHKQNIPHGPVKSVPTSQQLRKDGLVVTYSSPSVSSFKVPTGSMTDRRIKSVKMADDSSPASISSPQSSSTSEYSPDSDEVVPLGVIWQGEVNTIDLPVVKLQAFAVYGKAGEFMSELPRKLRQLGRIQPMQMWPYIEQVKPVKEVAVVVLKSPPGRTSNEFNSLHYFLTTRARVSVLGPLPSSFKDFYVIALRENEPLPPTLRFPDGVAFEQEHPKLFLGIIVHHPVRASHVGRGMFDIPALSPPGKNSPYDSPTTPSSVESSPYGKPDAPKKSDPIISKFLALSASGHSGPTKSDSGPIKADPGPIKSDPGSIKSDAGPVKLDPGAMKSEYRALKSESGAVESAYPAQIMADSPDTSEPMDIDDDLPTAKIVTTPSASVSLPDLLKVVKSLPDKQPVGATSSSSMKPAIVAPPAMPMPVDPRLKRLTTTPQPQPTTTFSVPPPTSVPTFTNSSFSATDTSAPIFSVPSFSIRPMKPASLLPDPVPMKPFPSAEALASLSLSLAASSKALSAQSGATTQPVKNETNDTKEDDGFGFSKKFIENLARIQLPPGLKEALRSITTTPLEVNTPAPQVRQPENSPPPAQPGYGPSPPLPHVLGFHPPRLPLPGVHLPGGPPPHGMGPPPGMHMGGGPPSGYLPGHQQRPQNPPGPYGKPALMPTPIHRPPFPPQGFQEPIRYGERFPPPPGAYQGPPPPGNAGWHREPPRQFQANPNASQHHQPPQHSPPQQQDDRGNYQRPQDRDRHYQQPENRWGDLDNQRLRGAPRWLDRDRERDRERDRDRGDRDRDRRSDDHRGNRDDRWSKSDHRSQRRSHSRSRSPSSRRRSRNSRDRSSDGESSRDSRRESRKRDAPQSGVDEFGRDISLRHKVERSTSRSQERDSFKSSKSQERDNSKSTKSQESDSAKGRDVEKPASATSVVSASVAE